MKRKYKPCATMVIGKGLDYITSTPGIMKILEFVALLISLSCISGFINTLNNSRGTWDFFVFSVAAAWIVTIVAFFFFTLGVHKRFSSINWILTMAIVYFILTVLLLIAAGILADNTRSYKVSGLCDSWKTVSGDIECNNLIVAVIFAFFAFALYTLDTFFHFWLSVVADPNASAEETAEMEPNREQPSTDNGF